MNWYAKSQKRYVPGSSYYCATCHKGRLKGQYPQDIAPFPGLKKEWDRGGFGTITTKPLWEMAERLVVARTAEGKLLPVDQMLNVIHQRGDLATLFVEGDNRSLSQLSSRPTL